MIIAGVDKIEVIPNFFGIFLKLYAVGGIQNAILYCG